MDKADEELKESIKKLWPLLNAKKLNLLVPPKEGIILIYMILTLVFKPSKFHFLELRGSYTKRKLTIGKIYAGLLILENYRAFKQSKLSIGDIKPVNNNK